MMTEFVIDARSKKLSLAIQDKYARISYDTVRKLLRKGEIRVNGKKVFSDILVKSGDVVRVYGVDVDFIPKVIFEDDNIAVYYKPPKMPSVGRGSFDEAVKERHSQYVICHRLDTNTDGLLIFAKNNEVAEEMKRCFGEHEIEKKYLAVINGELTESRILTAYLKKDPDAKIVKIYDERVEGSDEIMTKIRPIYTEQGLSLIEVELVTGKTHQIRAHLAHIDMPIVGDPKYGDNELNHHYRKFYQMLHAYELTFRIKSGPLAYLNGKTVALDDTKYHDEFRNLLSHI